MQVASQKGQTIYHITKDNYSQILPQLKLSSHVMSDICDAISAGREVTAHERNISVKGWTSLGYVILALTTGAEAYLIGGGADGGMINFFGENQNLIVLLLVTRYSSYCKCFASFLISSGAPYNNFFSIYDNNV